MQKQKRLLSIGEASEYLNVSIDTLRRWEKKGKIESFRSPGNHRYFSINDLEKLFGRKYQHDAVVDKSKKLPNPPEENKETKFDKIYAVEEYLKKTDTTTSAPIVYPTFKLPEDERIINRPTRDIKIPEVKLIKVIQTKEEAKVVENQVQEMKSVEVTTSILTPANLEKKVSQESQEIKESEKADDKLSGQSEKEGVMKSKIVIYTTITIMVLIIIATIFFLIGASSREMLSPLP